MQFTVKQLADILNISKGTVTNYSNQLKLDLKKNSHGVIIISIDQSIAIAKAINENRTELNKVNVDRLYKIKSDSEIKMNDDLKEKFNSDTNKAEAQRNSNNDDLIEILKEQIKELKRDKEDYKQQLQIKDNQIKQLNDTLDEQQQLLHNQQSLQLQSKEKIKALEGELKEVKEDTTDISAGDNNDNNFYRDLSSVKQDSSKGFLSKLFKGGK